MTFEQEHYEGVVSRLEDRVAELEDENRELRDERNEQRAYVMELEKQRVDPEDGLSVTLAKAVELERMKRGLIDA